MRHTHLFIVSGQLLHQSKGQFGPVVFLSDFTETQNVDLGGQKYGKF